MEARCFKEANPRRQFRRSRELFRGSRRISQRQLAHEAGVHRSVVNRAKRGEDAQLSTWIKLFYGLGYEIMIDYCETNEEADGLLVEEADRRAQRRDDGLWWGRQRWR